MTVPQPQSSGVAPSGIPEEYPIFLPSSASTALSAEAAILGGVMGGVNVLGGALTLVGGIYTLASNHPASRMVTAFAVRMNTLKQQIQDASEASARKKTQLGKILR